MALAEGSGAMRSAHSHERRAQINQWMILAVLSFFVWQYTVQQWRISQAIKIESIEVSNIRLLSPAILCPGDTLLVAFDVDIRGFGIVIWDNSTQHEGHPAIFSQARRVPVDGPVKLNLIDEWQIPGQPEMLIDGKREWAPGQYARLVTVSASTSYVSRFIEPRKFTIPFEIAPTCK